MELTPVVLEGRYLRLEPIGARHLAGLWDAARYAEIWQWFPFRVDCADDLATLLARAHAELERGTGLGFVQIWKQNGQVIGSTSYLAVVPRYRRLEIGSTWLTPAFQRSAANTESKLLMMSYAFESLGCNRVEFKTDSRNARSRAALTRIGAVEEGTLRAHMINHDASVRDSVFYSVLKSEWPAVRERLQGLLRRHATP